MQMLLYLVSQWFLKVCSLFLIVFSFCFSVWLSFIALSSSSLICSALSNLLLNPSSMFSSVITSVWYSLFSVSWLKFSLRSSWVQWAPLWPLLWTHCQMDCLSPFSFFSLRFCGVLSFGPCFSVSSFCLCCCFWVVGNSTASQSWRDSLM